ncbi:MAG TPA: sigma-70 family RNA polymerase sigma factor [Candidatus Micrarchaeia archaeon]|nr:sigma-70 family RNA polymerase sigma factor [Candidatus Micrarchaeia archaeon]
MPVARDRPAGPTDAAPEWATALGREAPDPWPPAETADSRQRVLAAAYVAQAPAIYAFIVRRVGSAADAEDLTAETFLRALRGHQALDPGRVRGLLFAIARAALADHWSRLYSEAPSPMGTLEGARARGGEVERDTADGDDGAVSVADGALDNRIAAVLAGLPANYRRVLELRFLEGCSVRETAERMGLRAGNVRVLQLRALRRAAGLGSLLP